MATTIHDIAERDNSDGIIFCTRRRKMMAIMILMLVLCCILFGGAVLLYDYNFKRKWANLLLYLGFVCLGLTLLFMIFRCLCGVNRLMFCLLQISNPIYSAPLFCTMYKNK